jgi:hypothetical protein
MDGAMPKPPRGVLAIDDEQVDLVRFDDVRCEYLHHLRQPPRYARLAVGRGPRRQTDRGGGAKFYAMAGRRTLGFGYCECGPLFFRDDLDSGYASESGMRRFHVCRRIDSSLYSCDFCPDDLRCLLPLDCRSGGVEVHVVFVAVQMVRHEFVLIIQRNSDVVHIGKSDAVSC